MVVAPACGTLLLDSCLQSSPALHFNRCGSHPGITGERRHPFEYRTQLRAVGVWGQLVETNAQRKISRRTNALVKYWGIGLKSSPIRSQARMPQNRVLGLVTDQKEYLVVGYEPSGVRQCSYITCTKESKVPARDTTRCQCYHTASFYRIWHLSGATLGTDALLNRRRTARGTPTGVPLGRPGTICSSMHA